MGDSELPLDDLITWKPAEGPQGPRRTGDFRSNLQGKTERKRTTTSSSAVQCLVSGPADDGGSEDTPLTRILTLSRLYLINMGNEGRARDSCPPPPHPPGDLFLTGGPDEWPRVGGGTGRAGVGGCVRGVSTSHIQ
jgi:hypothetical protein